MPDTVKVLFNLDIESTDKINIVNNAGSALVKKNLVMFGSKEIGMINNSDIYQTYTDLSFT